MGYQKCNRCGSWIQFHDAIGQQQLLCRSCGNKQRLGGPSVLIAWLGIGMAVALFVVVFIAVGSDQPQQKTPAGPQQSLDKFLAAADAANIKPLIVSCEASGNTLTVIVHNYWHTQPKQLRLQAAQNMWAEWASIHTPSNLDKSRIKITDLNGNDVGGSRAIGGSMLWVAD